MKYRIWERKDGAKEKKRKIACKKKKKKNWIKNIVIQKEKKNNQEEEKRIELKKRKERLFVLLSNTYNFQIDLLDLYIWVPKRKYRVRVDLGLMAMKG